MTLAAKTDSTGGGNDRGTSFDPVYVFPTSYAQQRLWFMDQMEPGLPFYNLPCAVRLSGAIDVSALKNSIQEVVNRHESLRTTFASKNGVPLQVVSPAMDLAVPVVALEDLSEAERRKEIERRVEEESRRPFDLKNGPLIRALLLRISVNEFVAVITMHHIISDGWSMGVFVSEMSEIYAAYAAGRPPMLAELPIQYADFADWQRQWLTGDVLDCQLSYWKARLGGELPALEMPGDRPRPARPSFRGQSRSVLLPREVGEGLKSLSLQEGATLFMTLLAAFQTLLYRYTGQTDICVGSPIANRNRAEIEGLIGFFVNTLVFRSDLSGDPSFRELLQRMRRIALEAYEHQDLPFEMVVEAVEPERSSSFNPLFQVMFILQNAATPSRELPGVRISQLEAETGSSTFDLTLSMTELFDGLHADIEYSTDLFDEATIIRLLDNFGCLLAGIVADPDAAISGLPLISPQERQRVLLEWNDSGKSFAQAQETFAGLFEARAAKRPESPAVVAPAANGTARRQISYGELSATADRLAHELIRRGVGSETVVGICLEDPLALVTAVLGIMKAGGAYLALDPLQPEKRHSLLLRDSGAAWVLTSRHTNFGTDGGLAPQRLCLEDLGLAMGQAGARPERGANSNPLAYVVYTSGSTGEPKGVLVRQRSLVNACLAWQEAYRLSPQDVHLQMANCAFDVFTGDLVRALGSGGRLVMCARDYLLAPHRLYEVMLAEAVTCAEFVPAVLRSLAGYLREAGLDLEFMRLLICGSDVWYAREYADFQALLGSQGRLVNSFGLAEATIDSCYFESRRPVSPDDRLVPIGRPFANSRLYVLDRHLDPLPVGVPGELYVGGTGVADGYMNRPELSAVHFIPDPFGRTPGSRFYRTGDLARYLPAGDIEFLGRLDHQIKIRGMRVEPGEIESVLKQAPGVRDAVVASARLRRPAADNDVRTELLAAYLVTDLAVERVPIEARCTVRPSQKEAPSSPLSRAFELRTSDLSFNGLCLTRVPDFWRQGQSLELDLELPVISQTIQVHGNIAWMAGGSAGISMEPSPGQRVLLRRTIDSLLYAPDLVRTTDDVDLRISIQGTCFLEVGGARRLGGQVESISRGTVRLLSRDVDWEKGCELRIGLQLSGSADPLWLDGTVLWNRGGRIGLSLSRTPEQKALLDRYVREFIQSKKFSVAEVSEFVKARLPAHMVPAAYVLLDRLPLSANGKVDRRALPEPDEEALVRKEGYLALRSPVEEVLAGLWSEVLDVERVGVLDDFFGLGGHSLLATQVVSRVRAAFGVELPLRSLFENPTVAGMAVQVQQLIEQAHGVQAPPLVKVSRQQALPLSFAQQRLWFLDQLEPGSGFYNLPETVRVRGRLDLGVLDRCLNEIIRRHEVLRTAFETEEGQARQVIWPELSLKLPVVDLSGLAASQRQAECARRVQAAAQAPFDLSHPPLLRAEVLHLADEEQVIVLILHHIIGDAWSSNVLMQELAVLYEAFSQERPSPLDALAIQYADYAKWQREWLQGEALEAQLGYWRRKLAGLPPLLELPTDRPRPAVQSFAGAYVSFELSAELSAGIERFCRQQGVTAFMLLLAAFKVLLHRYSGERDICVGTPIANRTRQEIEPLIGFFVNTLALRTDLSGEPGFGEVVQRVRETALAAYAHQDVPFETVVDALQPQRSLSHAPLFQAMFVLQNAMPRSRVLPDSRLELSSVEAHSGSAKFDLTLFMTQEGDRLAGAWEYNTDLFDAATIQRMNRHFERLLRGALGAPQEPIGRLALMSAAETRRWVELTNDSASPFPAQACMHDLFEAQAARRPQAPAVRAGGSELSYSELNRRADRLARYLQNAGVGPESRVGLCLERSVEMVVGLLGVLKAGGAYVPLDPGYPAERLSYMLADAKVQALLTQEKFRTAPWAAGVSNLLCLDTQWPAVEVAGGGPPARRAHPLNLAYVIYTSGSTGRPKGAMVHHRGLVNYLSWTQQAYPLEAGRGSPVHSSISFDLTVTSLLAPLTKGGCVHLAPEDFGVGALGEILADAGDFSLIKITPAHLQLLGEQVPPERAADCTRAFIIGGENLLPEHVAFWQQHAPDTHLVNEYGPTETVVGCCVYWTPPERLPSGVVPIGRPIINARLYVLDGGLQSVPAGVCGELFIGGECVGRGYFERPDLTAERYLPDPFSAVPGARMYRSGDRVRALPDGTLECLGRIDHQVKIRGFRIELGEIEAALGRCPGVREAAAWPYEEGGVKQLTAYVALTPEEVPDADRLKAQLRSELPEYMVPVFYVFMDRLPLTENGKVDRKALPAPERGAGEGATDFVAPRDVPEALLAEIWKELLRLDRVGVHDNFFELGGDSISSIQVVSRARRVGLGLSPRQVFEFPTIAGLAAAADASRIARAEQAPVVGPVPLTPIQRWFFEQEFPDPHHWDQSLLIAVHERLDPDPLRAAVRHILDHHDALRMRFHRIAEGWQQTNAPLGEAALLSWVDLSGRGAEQLDSEIAAAAAGLKAGLNLAEGPLIRFAYFDCGVARPGRILVVVHHLVMDAFSWPVLLEDLNTAYMQISRGQPVRLPPKTTSFRQWALDLEEYARLEATAGELEYWTAAAAESADALPADMPAGDNRESSAAAFSAALTEEETRRLLHAVPAAVDAGIQHALLAALGYSIGRWAGTSSVRVDFESHGREDIFEAADLSRTVGWFTALFPLVLDAAGEFDPQERVRRVKTRMAEVPRGGIGYGLLRYLSPDAAVRAKLKSLPAARIVFNYLGQSDQALEKAEAFEISAESPGPDHSPAARRTHWLEINGGVFSGCLQLEWTYSGHLYRRRTVQRLAGDFLDFLRALLEDLNSGETHPVIDTALEEFGWDSTQLQGVLAALDDLEADRP